MGINCSRDSNLMSAIQLDARNSKEGSKSVENHSIENVRPPRDSFPPQTHQKKRKSVICAFFPEKGRAGKILLTEQRFAEQSPDDTNICTLEGNDHEHGPRRRGGGNMMCDFSFVRLLEPTCYCGNSTYTRGRDLLPELPSQRG
jgi:hypothetical protein